MRWSVILSKRDAQISYAEAASFGNMLRRLAMRWWQRDSSMFSPRWGQSVHRFKGWREGRRQKGEVEEVWEKRRVGEGGRMGKLSPGKSTGVTEGDRESPAPFKTLSFSGTLQLEQPPAPVGLEILTGGFLCGYTPAFSCLPQVFCLQCWSPKPCFLNLCCVSTQHFGSAFSFLSWKQDKHNTCS